MKNTRFAIADTILFEDDDFFVINKPPFISTLEDRRDKLNILSAARDHEPAAQVCHRLDKETSGVLAIAKNPEAYRHLAMQFENRQVGKIYHAVVDGIHNFKNLLIDIPIVKQPDGVAKISKKDGKPAQTWVTTLKAFRFHTLLECRPVTGRMHQIRIHLASQKAPITGDETYGGKPFLLSSVKRGFNLKKDTEEGSFLKRMALHAYSLEFQDLAGKLRKIEAPYPRDMQALIRQLELNS